MKLILTLLMVANLWGANYNCTSTGTGDFNAAGTWASCNSTYPNNSTDTFTFSIGATHDVTIPAGVEITIGQSLAANTAQGTMANTGQLILAAGSATDPTILTMKGDLAITTVTVSCTLDGSTNCNAVEMNPGTVLLIDSDGSGTAYSIGQTAGGNSRWFKANCTDATSMPAWAVGTTYERGYRVSYGGVNYISTANSNTGNTPHLFDSDYWQKGNCLVMSIGATNGNFGRRGFAFGGGNVYMRSVAVKNLGTSSVDSVTSMADTTNNPVGGGDIADSSFMDCGAVDLTDGQRTATSIHRFSNSINVDTLASDGIAVILSTSTTPALTSGVREIKENVFQNSIVGTTGSGYCYGCTVEGNYSRTTSVGYSWTGGNAGTQLSTFKGNYVYKNSTNNTLGPNVPILEYNYVVNGFSLTNVRGFGTASAVQATDDQIMRYNVIAHVGTDTAGDAIIVSQAANGSTYTLTGNANELNSINTSCCNIITDGGISSPGGTDNHIYRNNFQLGTLLAAIYVETSVHWAGSITAQNNTMLRFGGTSMAKVGDAGSCTTNPNDVCSAAQCNYNLGIAIAGTPAGTCTNAHNGYWLDLSAASGWGANDVDLTTVEEAQFTDLKRTFATAANKFFGQSATAGAWSNASVSYAVGDIVSDSQSIWQGETVLYRALAAHTSADTSRPGNGATWQTACGGGPCWEYATEYFLRDMIAKGTRITDASIGANNDYPTQAMAKWVLHGRISHRRDLQCMGNDGESPWPIPYCEKGRAVAAAISGF